MPNRIRWLLLAFTLLLGGVFIYALAVPVYGECVDYGHSRAYCLALVVR